MTPQRECKRTLGNQLLIAMQAPDARFVAGFHAWKDLGRSVRKGEHGIRILAPMPLRRDDESAAPAADDRDQGRVVTLFKSVAVFDTLSRDRWVSSDAVARLKTLDDDNQGWELPRQRG